MLSYILSALSLARHAVALTLVAGAAATTMVAGSVDQIGTQVQPVVTSKSATPEMSAKPQTTTGDLETLVKDCLTKYAALKSSTTAGTAASLACRSAIEASGLTSTEFWTRFAPRAEPSTAPVKPSTTASTKPTNPTTDLETLVKDCLAKYAALKTSPTAGTAASLACRRAIEASGLTSTEFWTRFGPKAEPSTAPVKPSTTASTKPSNPTTNIEALVKDCFAKYIAAKDSTTGATAASEACRRAIEASGLGATEFWAKFGTPQAPKSTPKTTATPTTPELSQLTRYCLTMHASLTTTSSREQVERTTTVCNQAIAESRLTPAEFWAKFSAYR